MKRIFSALILLALTLQGASAQSRIGTFSIIPRAGVSITKVRHDSGITYATDNSVKTAEPKYRTGGTAGVDLQYQFDDRAAVSLGVFYAREGSKYEDTTLGDNGPGTYQMYEDWRMNLDYINVPLLAHYYVAKGLSVEAGAQAGFLVSKKIKGKMRTVTVSENNSYSYDSQSTKFDTDLNVLRTFEVAIPVGVSYEYENVVLDARYVFGVTKLAKKELDSDAKNAGFYITAGYKFDL
jgi:hypothetical protein